MIVMSIRWVAVLVTTLAVGATSACGTAASNAGGDRLTVAAAFYPLEYVVTQVGGDHVAVEGLTKPGAEPHDLELTPKQVASVARADVVVYEKHFQPAVDAAVAAQAPKTGFDVSPAARLDLVATADGHDTAAQTEQQGTAAAGLPDPHFWLDPLRFADVGDAVARELAAKDPANTAAYQAGAARFRATMTTLDAQFRAGLATCTVRELVTSHAAFGYLAETYGFHQESITGLSPDAEPNPAALAQLTHHVEQSGATTVYSETLVSTAVAETLARETGARLAVLDPIEGITTASAGTDYPSVMRANLQTLRTGQECS